MILDSKDHPEWEAPGDCEQVQSTQEMGAFSKGVEAKQGECHWEQIGICVVGFLAPRYFKGNYFALLSKTVV